MDERDQFDDFEMELADGPAWRLAAVTLFLGAALIILGVALSACGTPGPLPPLPPVPDISGPPLMARPDAGYMFVGGVLERDDAGAPRYRTGVRPCEGGAR